jgi:hypothetical protein
VLGRERMELGSVGGHSEIGGRRHIIYFRISVGRDVSHVAWAT